LRNPHPDVDHQFGHRACGWGWHLHRRLVGLDRQQRHVDRDLVADRHIDFDYRDILVVPNIWQNDFN